MGLWNVSISNEAPNEESSYNFEKKVCLFFFFFFFLKITWLLEKLKLFKQLFNLTMNLASGVSKSLQLWIKMLVNLHQKLFKMTVKTYPQNNKAGNAAYPIRCGSAGIPGQKSFWVRAFRQILWTSQQTDTQTDRPKWVWIGVVHN